MTAIVSSDKYNRESVVFFGNFLQSERKTVICPIMHLTLILAVGRVCIRGKEFWLSMCFLAGSVCSRDTCTSLYVSLTRQGLRVLPDKVLIIISYLTVTPMKKKLWHRGVEAAWFNLLPRRPCKKNEETTYKPLQ